MRIVGAFIEGQGQVDLRIDGSVIASITPSDPAANARIDNDDFDARGLLLVTSLAEPHAHLDKAFLAERVHNVSGDLMGAIESMRAASSTLTFDDTVERASRAVRLMIRNGVTRIRTHADTFDGSTMQVQALRAVAKEFQELCDIQVCALIQWPLSGPEGAPSRHLAEQARRDGADLIGGCPHLDTNPAAANQVFLDLARDFDCALDLHVDETLNPAMLSLQDLAQRVGDNPLPFGVTASHCVSLGMQDHVTQRSVAELLASSGVSVVTLPQTNLYLQGREHPTAMPRGLTALRALGEAGVRVAGGADNLQDPFNPMGRGDPLETAALLVAGAHYLPEEALRAVSQVPHEIVANSNNELRVGSPADLLLAHASNIRELIAFATHERAVFYRGQIVSNTLVSKNN